MGELNEYQRGEGEAGRERREVGRQGGREREEGSEELNLMCCDNLLSFPPQHHSISRENCC